MLSWFISAKDPTQTKNLVQFFCIISETTTKVCAYEAIKKHTLVSVMVGFCPTSTGSGYPFQPVPHDSNEPKSIVGGCDERGSTV